MYISVIKYEKINLEIMKKLVVLIFVIFMLIPRVDNAQKATHINVCKIDRSFITAKDTYGKPYNFKRKYIGFSDKIKKMEIPPRSNTKTSEALVVAEELITYPEASQLSKKNDNVIPTKDGVILIKWKHGSWHLYFLPEKHFTGKEGTREYFFE